MDEWKDGRKGRKGELSSQDTNQANTLNAVFTVKKVEGNDEFRLTRTIYEANRQVTKPVDITNVEQDSEQSQEIPLRGGCRGCDTHLKINEYRWHRCATREGNYVEKSEEEEEEGEERRLLPRLWLFDEINQ